jgi:hypothetical protein
MLLVEIKLNWYHVTDGSRICKVNIVMEEKYTAQQYATMSGGHTLEPETKAAQYGFIGELNESKLFRTRRQLETSDIRSNLDFAFMNMLTLHTMYNDYKTAPAAQEYAKRTLQAGGGHFKNYKTSGTDLYHALHAITTGTGKQGKEAAIQAAKVRLPEVKIRQYLQQIANGRDVISPQAFFMQLERGMDIQNSNYRSVRRIVSNWNNSDTAQRALASTRMLQYYRTKAMRSELFPGFQQMTRNNGLEIARVRNAEKGPSKLRRAAVGAVAGAAAFAGGFAAGRALGKKLVS